MCHLSQQFHGRDWTYWGGGRRGNLIIENIYKLGKELFLKNSLMVIFDSVPSAQYLCVIGSLCNQNLFLNRPLLFCPIPPCKDV